MPVLLRCVLGCLAACLLLPSGAVAQALGVIEGRVVVPDAPARKTVSRYPTGTLAARGMQGVAPVVYLTGPGLAGEAAAGQTLAPGEHVEVLQSDTAFAPSAIAIRTGSTVAFPNGDPFFHNVFSYSGNVRFDLGRYPEGASRQVAFQEEGIALVLCEVHEFMRAVVLVTDHPFHAVVEEDGSFRLEGVPPGEYSLVVYHPDAGRVEQRVVVGAGERVRAELALGR